MNELDTILMRLAQAPLPAGFAAIEEVVLARVAAGAAYRTRRGVGIATIAVALVMGIAGAVMPSREVAATPLTPFGPISPLSPAALLGGNR
ncbi:hypothetical protein [Sphingomonas sp.]|uniref:hypothetical protein n=1 Tax=Sphingomonas sp. TaxID=28214 RepID=UPI00286B3642|nr:hypothetical protein [Sphingomonas sp.]